MRVELKNALYTTVEKVKYDPRLQGLVAASIFFLAGILAYIPDHKMMGTQLPVLLDGRIFDAASGGWAAGIARFFRKDDVFASVAVGYAAPAGIEILQKLGMIEGVYDKGDFIAPLFGIAAFLASYYAIKWKSRHKISRADFILGRDFPFKDIRQIKLFDREFPLLRI